MFYTGLTLRVVDEKFNSNNVDRRQRTKSRWENSLQLSFFVMRVVLISGGQEPAS